MFSAQVSFLADPMVSEIAARLLMGWLGFSVIMASAWLLWRLTGNAGFVDGIWTFGVSSVSFLLAIVPMSADGLPLRRLIVALVVALWGARLGTHIWKRSRHKGNDPRYLSLIEQWGAQAAMRMFLFLQIQALCSLPLMLSIACAAHHRAPDFGPIDVLACAVAVVAVVGEAIADEQLRRFAATRSGVCDIGLWRYSRHPNYFFEFLLWCAFPLFALSGTVGFASVAALAGPLCMYWLLVYVSGVPPLEDHMLVSRGEAYRAYQQRTAMFFPLPPHNQA